MSWQDNTVKNNIEQTTRYKCYKFRLKYEKASNYFNRCY